MLPFRAVDVLLKRSLALYTFLALGCFLAVAPWTPLWQEATILLLPTRFGVPAQGPYLRAVVSAIGVLDLWVALGLIPEIVGAFRQSKKKNGD